MQEISYYDRQEHAERMVRDFFGGQTYEEVEYKMNARCDEIRERGPVHTIHRVKIGRNAPCPCGSGKKFKKCCIDQMR